MTSRLAGLTGATLETAPSVCQACVWWQSRGTREPEKRKWIERAEEEWGAWGTVYRDDDGRVLGSMQYRPSSLFPRAADLPAGMWLGSVAYGGVDGLPNPTIVTVTGNRPADD